MNSKVDEFLDRATKWQPEMKKLREIALGCGLTEEIKWSKPCYISEGKNIVVIQGFKAYCALLFFKGYLVSDPKHILVKTGENTVVGRQARFTDVKDIVKVEAALKACIKDAIKVEKAGIKPPNQTSSLRPKAADRVGAGSAKSPKTKYSERKA